MSETRRLHIESLFGEALATEGDARQALLAGADPALRAEVEDLLAAHGRAGAFIETAIAAAAAGVLDQENDAGVNRRFGAYRTVRLIGRGGMGAVYLAERADGAYEQRVALKVVPAGALGLETQALFTRERRILAALTHPNIARLLDGGTADDGTPFLVMEYVEGEPIDQFCDRRGLALGARLEIFRAVCNAVHYAHTRLVVHRDLKPSNILVTSDGTPKLLDFGIAKLVDHEGSQDTMTRARLLTPESASPEQVRGEPVTTASDVYSLGVLLYRLIAGVPPYRLEGLRGRELEQVICEIPPPPPSAALESTRDLPAELDNIVLMTLRKEPARRYASAAALSEDVLRHLRGLPVTAQPSTWSYRARKLVARNRLAVAGVGAVLVLSLAFAGAMAVQARRLALQRDLVERQRERAVRVSEFLVGLFRVADPSEARGNAVTAREVLDRGSSRIRDELTEEPEVQAELLDTMAEVYRNLGLYAESIELFERGLAAAQRAFGENDAHSARAANNLAGALMNASRFGEAEVYYRQALALNRALVGARSSEVATNLANLGWALRYQGKLDAAEAHFREALAVDSALASDSDPQTATHSYGLAQLLQERGKLLEAERLYQAAYDFRRRALPADHPQVVESLYGLARVAHGLGRYELAQERLQRVLEIDRKLYGDSHPYLADDLHTSGCLAADRGEFARARQDLSQALAIQREALGESHPKAVLTLSALGWVTASSGRPDEGVSSARRALAQHRAKVHGSHPDLGQLLLNLGRALAAGGSHREAVTLLRESVQVRETLFGVQHPGTAESLLELARALAAAGDRAEAVKAGGRALSVGSAVLPSDHPQLAAARALAAGAR